MLTRLIAIGSMLIATIASAQQSSGGAEFYRAMQTEVRTSLFLEDEIDEQLIDYLHLLFGERFDIEKDQIEDLLKDSALRVCIDPNNESEELKSFIECDTADQTIRRVAEREMRIRDLGRRLQVLTTGYELPVTDLPGRSVSLTEDIRGIATIWMAGTGGIQISDTNDKAIRTYIEEDTGVYQSDLDRLKNQLEDMEEDEMVGAVWRYQHGVRLLRGDRDNFYPAPYDYNWDIQDSPEQEYLFKRWDGGNANIESTLMNIWNTANNTNFDPPLGSDEVAYVSFPENLYGDMLPENVIVWARVDGNTTDDQPYGDVGLTWRIPQEPVYPTIVDYDSQGDPQPNMGGRYPYEPVERNSNNQNQGPKPVDGRGLCTELVAERGYLCRQFEIVSPEERCLTDKDREPNTIQLIQCSNPVDLAQEGVWCCNQQSQACTLSSSNTSCVQGGGSPSATADGCTANGCSEPDPIWCCLPNNNQCALTLSANECTDKGGTPSADEDACRANGCSMPETFQRTTLAGADVCRELNWREVNAFNASRECTINLQCTPNCFVNGGGESETKEKDGNGEISICIQDQNTTLQSTYLVYRELVRAYQQCNLPQDELKYEEIPPRAGEEMIRRITMENTALCCQREGEINQALCALMEQDGLFQGGPIGDIPLNAQTCAEALTDYTCEVEEGFNGCYVSYDYDQAFATTMLSLPDSNPKDLPDSCTDAIDEDFMDIRVAQLLSHIEKQHDVCEPGQVNLYQNRIGNNACYIGQCVEQTVELHKVVPGQVPAVTQGQISPWEDPLSASPLALGMTNYQESQARLPEYRPKLLVQEVERTLCRAQGLPPLTPPILCQLSAERQLGLKRLTSIDALQGLIRQDVQEEDALADILEMSPALGYRAGSSLYAEYLRASTRSFAGILTNAANILSDLQDISFPTEMCTVPDIDPAHSSGSQSS